MELLKAVTDLVKALIWPALLLFFVLYYQGDFRTILQTREVKVGASGIEIGALVGNLVETIKTTQAGVDQTLQRLAQAPPQDQSKIKDDLKRNLTQDLGQIETQLAMAAQVQQSGSAAIQQVAPVPPPPSPAQSAAQAPATAAAMPPTVNATDRERQGFRLLAARNFDAALDEFNAAYRLYPDLHNVAEIRQLLNDRAGPLKARDDGAWKDLYSAILTKYAWGIPPEVRNQFKAAAGPS